MGQTFEELIGLHLDDLYSAALCFTLDELRAEELLQEASIRAFHEFPRRRQTTEFRDSMLEVLVSTYLQRERRTGRDPLATDTAPKEEVLYATAGIQVEPFPEPGTPGYRLLRHWMNQTWAQLDDGDRLVLWLADVERLRHTAIAGLVGRDEEDVRNRHYRARLMLSQGAARQLVERMSGDAEA
jgi:RNA polymerase sigma-70 factor (ECF subfamily)